MTFNWMPFKRLYHSVMHVRSVCYSAFGTPGLGITWSLVTLLSGLLYLIYDERKRRNFQLESKNGTVELGNSCEAAKGRAMAYFLQRKDFRSTKV
jgi:hypothetical protein